MNISAVVLTKNEEKNIEDCLKSLSFCSEVIVVDDNSSDKTTELAKKAGALVFVHPLNLDFSSQRNFGLHKAKEEWVLFVDADERVSKELKDEIITSLEKVPCQGFFIKRADFMWGKQLQHGETGEKQFLRIARAGSGIWEGRVHERWIVKGKTPTLKNPLFHYPHQSVSEFLSEVNFYTTIRAEELHQNKIAVNWWSILFYPKAKFFVNFILKLGFLDGTPGFIVAMLMSFHSFLVRGKLWYLNQRA